MSSLKRGGPSGNIVLSLFKLIPVVYHPFSSNNIMVVSPYRSNTFLRFIDVVWKGQEKVYWLGAVGEVDLGERIHVGVLGLGGRGGRLWSVFILAGPLHTGMGLG